MFVGWVVCLEWIYNERGAFPAAAGTKLRKKRNSVDEFSHFFSIATRTNVLNILKLTH